MINYVTGDSIYPPGEGLKVITHICNNKDRWGAGFALELSKRWSRPEAMYHHLYSGQEGVSMPRLGDIHVVLVEVDIVVVNMVAQNGLPSKNNPKPCDLPALKNCLMTLKHRLDDAKIKPSIHMPKIGTGFGGRDWTLEIEPIVDSTIALKYNVTVYTP